ncbi:MAG: hypothetical protein Q9168_002066 [Polycauliona sp. 1 TL-2023]
MPQANDPTTNKIDIDPLTQTPYSKPAWATNYLLLPIEIQHEILSHLTSSSSPIHLRGLSSPQWDTQFESFIQGQASKYPMIHLFTPPHRFFYRDNTLSLCLTKLVAFLNHQSFPVLRHRIWWSNRPTVALPMERPVRYYVTSLIVSIGRQAYGDPEPRTVLAELLSCPSLRTVTVQYGYFGTMREFLREFGKIEGVCEALGARLGRGMVKIEVT